MTKTNTLPFTMVCRFQNVSWCTNHLTTFWILVKILMSIRPHSWLWVIMFSHIVINLILGLLIISFFYETKLLSNSSWFTNSLSFKNLPPMVFWSIYMFRHPLSLIMYLLSTLWTISICGTIKNCKFKEL